LNAVVQFVRGVQAGFSCIANFISRQQRFDLLAGAQLGAHPVLTCTHQIAHHLVMLIG
jgi:hypothetical protein